MLVVGLNTQIGLKLVIDWSQLIERQLSNLTNLKVIGSSRQRESLGDSSLSAHVIMQKKKPRKNWPESSQSDCLPASQPACLPAFLPACCCLPIAAPCLSLSLSFCFLAC